MPSAQSVGRVDVLRFYGIREFRVRRDAGGLWGLNPFISLGLDFMMLSEESKESQDATFWWNLVRRFPDGLLGNAGIGQGPGQILWEALTNELTSSRPSRSRSSASRREEVV